MVPLIRVIFISRIYGHLLPRRRSAVRGICQWGSVYFRIPRADSEILWLSAQRLSDDDDVSVSSVYFGTPLSWICGYIFPQMVVISSEIRASVQMFR